MNDQKKIGDDIPFAEEPGIHSIFFFFLKKILIQPFVYKCILIYNLGCSSLSLFTFMRWRRKWQPTPAFLPGESPGQKNLVGYSPWGHKESDTMEHTCALSCHPVLHAGPPGGTSFYDSLSSSFQIQLVIPDSAQHNVQLCCFLAASAVP